MYVRAFYNIRSAIEILRLFRLYIQNEEFRKAYLNNDNIDFRKTGDYASMQSKINSRLEKLEHELRKCELIPMASILGNHRFTKGSNLSDLHSELSKWSHALNVNLLFSIFISENKIKLSIENDDTTYSGLYVKKYTELACLICMDQYELLSPNLIVDKDKIEKNYYQLLKSYEKYIELYY